MFRSRRRRGPQVSGLVRLRSRVREQVSRGLEPSALLLLRAEVDRHVTRVEELCRARGTTPSRLPGPTRNAYRYLKRLDLDAVPRGERPLAADLRLRGLVAAYKRVADQLAGPAPDVVAARALATRVVARVDARLASDTHAGHALPPASAGAREALARLREPGAVEALLESSACAQAAVRALVARHRPKETRPVTVRLVPTSALWRVRETPRAITVSFSDAFTGAPPDVLDTLARWAFGRDEGRGRGVAESWIASRRAPPEPAAARDPGARGLHHDLDALFDELNRDFFAGALERPRLGWTAAPTYHKFGTYAYAQDRVTLSASLDHAGVPPFVVAYVLYHELLHKALGLEGDGQRRRAHTVKFRARERLFPRYDDAVELLDRLARRWRRRD